MLMMERYDSKDDMKAHFASPHFKAMSAKVMECLEGPPVVVRFNEIE
jgi:quinol monooxygenase YgiN